MKYIFLRNGTMKVLDEIEANSRSQAKEIYFEKDEKNKQRFKNMRLINEHKYKKELEMIEEYMKKIRRNI